MAVLLPIWLVKGLNFGPQLTFVAFYWFTSLLITTISTTLIVYRIMNMARRSNKTTSYYPTVEILVESGVMYTTVIVICCILWGIAVAKSDGGWNASLGYIRLNVASGAIYSLLIPVTVSRNSVPRLFSVGTQQKVFYIYLRGSHQH